MIPESCPRCAATENLNEVTITDDSGGSFIVLCDNCRDHIDTPRCHVCGDRMIGHHKADALFFMDSWSTAFNICDGCRTDLVFSQRRVAADG